jgi:hypothetical protein
VIPYSFNIWASLDFGIYSLLVWIKQPHLVDKRIDDMGGDCFSEEGNHKDEKLDFRQWCSMSYTTADDGNFTIGWTHWWSRIEDGVISLPLDPDILCSSFPTVPRVAAFERWIRVRGYFPRSTCSFAFDVLLYCAPTNVQGNKRGRSITTKKRTYESVVSLLSCKLTVVL